LGAAFFFAGGAVGGGAGRLRSSTMVVRFERGTQWIADIA
jgi:hypothetical protein